jgi:hypothetical protein
MFRAWGRKVALAGLGKSQPPRQLHFHLSPGPVALRNDAILLDKSFIRHINKNMQKELRRPCGRSKRKTFIGELPNCPQILHSPGLERSTPVGDFGAAVPLAIGPRRYKYLRLFITNSLSRDEVTCHVTSLVCRTVAQVAQVAQNLRNETGQRVQRPRRLLHDRQACPDNAQSPSWIVNTKATATTSSTSPPTTTQPAPSSNVCPCASLT